MNNTSLRQLYSKYNRELFNGRLPEDIKVVFSPRMGRGFRRRTYGYAQKRWGRYSITMSEILTANDPLQMHATLIHEMIHVWQMVTTNRAGHQQDFWRKAREIHDRTGLPIGRAGGLYPHRNLNMYLAAIKAVELGKPFLKVETQLPALERLKPAILEPSPMMKVVEDLGNGVLVEIDEMTPPTQTRNAYIDQQLKARVEARDLVKLVVEKYGITTSLARSHVYSRRWALKKQGRL